MYHTLFPWLPNFQMHCRETRRFWRNVSNQRPALWPQLISTKDQKPSSLQLSPSIFFPSLNKGMWVSSKQVLQISKAKTFGLGEVQSRNRWCGLEPTFKRIKYPKLWQKNLSTWNSYLYFMQSAVLQFFHTPSKTRFSYCVLWVDQTNRVLLWWFQAG